MKRELTLGVIGHVDHGKTALVGALTGTATDRLKEERERGMSIVLGFAYLETEAAVIDLVDVPGHEAFVRAMVAGATGFDGVVLVVAANEGIKPQTREHLAIAGLLGIRHGISVLTKADLVTRDEAAAAAAALRAFTVGTFLAGAPLVTASITDAASITAVRAALETLATQTELARPAGRDFFLPVDRVFTIRGFGVVATGTLRGGTLRTGDPLLVMPREMRVSVRGLQRHGHDVAEALPGQRVAVNLRGIERAELVCGDVLAAPALVHSTHCFDAYLQLLEDAPALANGRRVRVLTGTTEVLARLRLLDTAELAPGATGFVQLRTERPFATRGGERYLLRAYSPMRTLGGGRILDTQPRRHRRFDSAALAQLASRARGDPRRVLADVLAAAGTTGIACAATAADLDLSTAELTAHLEALGAVPAGNDRAVARSAWVELLDELVTRIEEFHAKHPRERGMLSEALRLQCKTPPDSALLRLAVVALQRDDRIETVDEAIRRRGFKPELDFDVAEQRIVDAIETAFRRAGLEPPVPGTVLGRDPRATKLYKLLLERGRLIRLNTYARGTQIVLHADTLARVQRELAGRYPHPQRFTVAEARDLLGTTRKHVTPLMEHLDAAGFTIRVGDVRQLRAP